MAKKNKIYQIQVEVTLETSVEVSAESYEQALAKGREIGVRDVVDFDTDFNDGSVKIVGVWNSKEEAHK